MSEVSEITERYHLGGVIGSVGDMRSMRAIDRATGEAVVFELVPRAAASDDDRRDRFLAAAAVLAGLQHSALPAVLDCGVTPDGDLFLVRDADLGRDLNVLVGESPAQVLELLAQAVEALALLDLHGLHHGALGVKSLRLVPGAAGALCRVVDLAHGLALGVSTGAEAARRRRGDLHAFALLACHLLGARPPANHPAGPAFELPLAVSFEIDDAEPLRSLLDRCLRREDLGWEEARSTLAGAARGAGREKPGPGSGPPPQVRLTFSTEPPDGGLMPPAEQTEAATDELAEIIRALTGGAAVTAAPRGWERGEDWSLADETQPVADLTQALTRPRPGAVVAAPDAPAEPEPAREEAVAAPVAPTEPEPSPVASSPPRARGAYAAAPRRRGRRVAIAAVIVAATAAAAALAWLLLAG